MAATRACSVWPKRKLVCLPGNAQKRSLQRSRPTVEWAGARRLAQDLPCLHTCQRPTLRNRWLRSPLSPLPPLAGLPLPARFPHQRPTFTITPSIDTPTLTPQVFPCLHACLQDYTLDNRGDVGSWVREVAMLGLTRALNTLARQIRHLPQHQAPDGDAAKLLAGGHVGGWTLAASVMAPRPCSPARGQARAVPLGRLSAAATSLSAQSLFRVLSAAPTQATAHALSPTRTDGSRRIGRAPPPTPSAQ